MTTRQIPTSNDDKTEISSNEAKELLLKDYDYLADSFWKNEQMGETRVNWFITIVTAVSGGLVTLATTEHDPKDQSLSLIISVSSLFLLALGFTTLLRMMKRNETTDGYKTDMNAIREIFKEHLDNKDILRNYSPFGPGRRSRKFGGLRDIVIGINSFLFAGFLVAGISLLTTIGPKWAYLLLIIICSSIAFALQIRFLKPKGITHAGGIIYRNHNGIVEYLLIGPKNETENTEDEWLLPKGHVEPHEEHCETALREVFEETGIVARLVCSVGTARFVFYECAKEKLFPHPQTSPRGTGAGREVKQCRQTEVLAKYYLMESCNELLPPEQRRYHWCAYEEARNKLTHDENKRLLKQAEERRKQTSNKPSQPVAA